MFNKTRIFLTIAERPKYEFDIYNRGECFYKDVDGLLPMQEGQLISFRTQDNLHSTKIGGIMWLTEMTAMGIYTEVIAAEKEEYSNLYYVLECQGWEVCKIN